MCNLFLFNSCIIRISDNTKKTKKKKTLILCYFYQKCGFLWNRYRVQIIGELNTLSSYSLTHKQIIPHSPRKCGLLWKMYPVPESHKQIISHSPRKCGLLWKMYPVPESHCYTTFITVVKVLFLVKVNKLA